MNEEKYRLTQTGRVGTVAMLIGVVGLGLSLVGYFTDSMQFFHSYLAAMGFWISIALGGLFLTILHHLTGAVWSVALRRVFENVMATLPYLAILFLPVLFGIKELYHWSHPDAVMHDQLLQEKAPYLNPPFFIIRTVFYFAVWIVLSRLLYQESISQDGAAKPTELRRARKISPPGVILFALTISFAAFDWLMSLDAHWYSTIFGVYIFGGSVMGVLAFITTALLLMRRSGILAESITVEHYHDLGRLLFTFVVFWSYIAFSQYFLIWYANIPEETIFFQHRWVGAWKGVSLLLALGHFLVPFLILMIRAAKRNMLSLGVMSVWLLFMHMVDLHWIVLPNLHPEGFQLSWMDVTTFLGVGGLFVWRFWTQTANHALVPIRDPRLQKSLTIKN